MRRIYQRIFALLLVLSCLWAGAALADGDRVFDRAELFTASEVQKLEQEIQAFQEETGMDFVIVTSNESHKGSAQQIADAFYEQGGFGLDEEKSGILYYIDMDDRYHYLSTTGAMIDYMTDARIENAIDEVTRYLSAGAYAQGASQMISIVRQYIRDGIPEGQYRYDVVTGQRLTARHKALTKNEILLALVIGLAVCLIYVACVRSRYSLKGSTYHYSYQDNGSMKLTDQEDTYLRTTTTRVRKPDPPESTGSHGGGGGSGVHTSSSGTSHGGGGGHF
mgnify:CR=1 FL=1